MKNINIILASKSPRRQELLSQIGIEYSVFGTDFDETSVIYDGTNIDKYVIELAKGKCEEALKHNKHKIILGADTVVFYKNKILGKPKDKKEAFEYLKELSNDIHKVITGVYIHNDINNKSVSKAVFTEVKVQNLSDEEIEWYINSDTVLDAAGAYRIQKGFSRYIEYIKGSYSNVVGLPVNAVYNLLREIEI